jgi:cellulose synthase/poly-beta-1,6-N-acetylglucosamine synthase-like glycosyltransferase
MTQKRRSKHFIKTGDKCYKRGFATSKVNFAPLNIFSLQKIKKRFTAKTVCTPGVRLVLLMILAIILVNFINDNNTSVYVTMIVVNLLYFFANSYKLHLFFSGLKILEHSSYQEDASPKIEGILPMYTIMIALYHEANIIDHLFEAILRIDYPKNKLQVILLLESDDQQTKEAIDKVKLPANFEILIVPKSDIKSKPNALNWGLKKAKGEFVVVYDAEDRPDPDQLKKVVQKFRCCNDDVVCIQARLNFYNAEENLLTRFFAVEYATLFNYILPAITLFGNPMPLGGTSNHFKIDILKKLGGWDPYNVTEDADLGLRIAVSGFKTLMVCSYTPEEATISLKPWLMQRSRWLKGYLHTYLIYMRMPLYLLEKYRLSGFIFFTYTLLLSPLLLVITPIMICFSIMIVANVYCYGPGAEFILQSLTWFNLIFCYLSLTFSAYIIYAIDGFKAGKFWWLYSFYPILQIAAGVMAVYKIMFEPHKWDKTPHGLSKKIKKISSYFFFL